MSNSFSADSLIGIGLTAAMWQQLIARPAYAGETPMRVIEIRRDALCVHDGAHERLAVVPPAIAQALTDDAPSRSATGCWSHATARPDAGCSRTRAAADAHRAARRRRPRRHPVVSNVDTALLVMGLDDDFNPRRLERYLALVHRERACRRWSC